LAREDDYDLVRQVASRRSEESRAAFDELFRRHRETVFNLSVRVLGDRSHAADVTQETFLTVLRKAGRFDFRAAFSSWLYRITVNRCIDLKRKLSKHPTASLSVPEVRVHAEGAGDSVDPGDAASQGELAETVAKEVSRLNPRLSVVVVLRYTEGLGYVEIAEILEVPLGTVKSRLSRAHAALEAALGPRLDDHRDGNGE
jgi:RNA polymerase sigma-70 factor (ECF subfamily)